ncbi:hypothetical protein [Nocardioides sp. URHA0020]|uniref:hypothetical protein n=1 Tax=Nocardioides sp. URHA0020 TaxID=1380392 RepID=UPI00048C28BB|nr:hypothetical protein [Nocardioides sp. URHA0020]
MGSKHRRSWSSLDDETREFPSGFWAVIGKVDGGGLGERLVGAIVGGVSIVVEWLLGGIGLGISRPDPRYRVLVGRTGSQSVLGVREARTRRQANRDLEAVAAILRRSTAQEARDAFDLDF